MAIYSNRKDAGRKLAVQLSGYANRKDVLILALPRGGVPVAYEAARSLKVPMDIIIVRKLGAPGHEELAMGAIAFGGIRIINEHVVSMLNIPQGKIEQAAAIEQQELERREKEYRGERPHPEIKNKTVIVIDDGLATGATMKAAVSALQTLNPKSIIVAVPISSRETCSEFEEIVDEVVCAHTPLMFRGVGQWYEDFTQTTDAEVINLLKEFAPEKE